MSKKRIKNPRTESKRRKALAEKRAAIAQNAKRQQMMRDLRILDDLDLLQFLTKPNVSIAEGDSPETPKPNVSIPEAEKGATDENQSEAGNI